MSGLDSIALAVAHLEELSKQQEGAEPVDIITAGGTTHPHSPAERSSPTLATQPQPAAVPPKSLHSNPRVVSSDSISASYDENDGVDARPSPPPAPTPKKKDSAVHTTKGPKNNLALILADPHAWLRTTEHLKIPAGPDGFVEGIEENDVLCGRGGESNHHPGNQQYRKLVKAFQPLYIASKRRFKPKIAQCIVYTVRSFGGRFLKREDASRFEDVGNVKAREKTSQALREGAPELRGVMEPDGPEGAPVSNTSKSPVVVAGLPTTQVPNMAAGALPANFINQQAFLQAQIGAYNGTFGALLPTFNAFNPYQQALWMNSQAQQQAAAVNGNKVAAPPLSVTAPAMAIAALSGQKRPLNIVSSEENSSTSSAESAPRGPRLKRLKQRLTQEHSDDETSKN